MGKHPEGIKLVKIIKRGKEYSIQPGSTLKVSLSRLDILPEMVLAIRNGEMLTEDEQLGEGETIVLIEVISGG